MIDYELCLFLYDVQDVRFTKEKRKNGRMEILKIFFFISLYFILQFMIAVKGNSKIYYDKRFIIRRTGQNRF